MKNNNNTHDLFTMNLPVDNTPIDTVFITAYYLQRPMSFQHQTMAQWFSNAHGLEDIDFFHTTGSQAIKIAIVQKGYNKLPLDSLHTYNQAGEELNQRRRMK
jgi:hypothetical protein